MRSHAELSCVHVTAKGYTCLVAQGIGSSSSPAAYLMPVSRRRVKGRPRRHYHHDADHHQPWKRPDDVLPEPRGKRASRSTTDVCPPQRRASPRLSAAGTVLRFGLRGFVRGTWLTGRFHAEYKLAYDGCRSVHTLSLSLSSSSPSHSFYSLNFAFVNCGSM